MADDRRQAAATSGPDIQDPELMREQWLQRNLKILIAVMTLMIVAGLAAIAVRIVTMPASKEATLPSATIAAGAGRGEIALELPKGARIANVALDGNRLAVHYDGPDGPRITIVDLESGRRIADIKPIEAIPRD
jgi:hypothetical protein